MSFWTFYYEVNYESEFNIKSNIKEQLNRRVIVSWIIRIRMREYFYYFVLKA